MKFATGLTIVFSLLILCTVRIPAFAQSVGSACSTTNKVIYPTYTTGTNTAYVCDGAHLVALETVTGSPLQVGIGGAVSGTNLFSVNGNVGATKYCDYAGLNCFTAAGISGGSIGAPGSDRNVIYNSGGSLFADTGLNYTSAGRLGIGTTVPATMLDVGGDIRTFAGNDYIRLQVAGSNSNPTVNFFKNGGWNTKLEASNSGLTIYGGGSGTIPAALFSTLAAHIYPDSLVLGQTLDTAPMVVDATMNGTVGGDALTFRTFNTLGIAKTRFGITGRVDTANVYFLNSNVGVGTVAPLGGLDVENPVAAASGVAYGGRYQQTLTAAANNDSLTALYINPTFTNGSYTGVANNGLIVASGNVGIGTATPTHLFEVRGGLGYFSSGLLALSITPVNSGVTLLVGNGGATNLTFDKTVASGGTGNAWFSGGNVGIGTTTPNAKLTVSGGGISTGSASNTDLAGQLTLVAGTKSYTFFASYIGAPVCVASDTATAPVAAQVTTTASTMTLTVPGGANTDTFNYICVVRN